MTGTSVSDLQSLSQVKAFCISDKMNDPCPPTSLPHVVTGRVAGLLLCSLRTLLSGLEVKPGTITCRGPVKRHHCDATAREQRCQGLLELHPCSASFIHTGVSVYWEGMTWLQRAGSVNNVRMGCSTLCQRIVGTQVLVTMGKHPNGKAPKLGQTADPKSSERWGLR